MNFMRSKGHHLFLLLHVSLLCCSRLILTRHHNSNFVGVILFILFYFHTIWNKKRLVLLHELSVGCSSHMQLQLYIFCYRFGFLTNRLVLVELEALRLWENSSRSPHKLVTNGYNYKYFLHIEFISYCFVQIGGHGFSHIGFHVKKSQIFVPQWLFMIVLKTLSI